MNILEEIQNCPIEWKELGEVCSVNKGKQLNKNLLTDDGLYPAYNGGQTYSGRTNDYNVEANTIIVSQGGASAGFVNFVETKFWANAHCYYILPDETQVNNRFVYHFLKMNQKYLMDFQHGAGIPALKSDKLTKLLIPVAPIKIQDKIVQILDKFTDYVTELTSELTSRKKQYSFYRDKLLSFEDEVYQVEWKTILDVSKKVTSGGTPDRSNSLYYGGSIPWLRTQEVDFREIYGTELSITEEGLANSSAKWIEKNAVIVAMYGATAAKVGIAKIPLTTNQACCNIEVDEDIANYRYVYHWLTYNYEALKSMGQGSQSNINAGVIKSFKIPVPSLEIQSRIVQVLDNFDMVCNDLNIGLPKEIELRQKQYEYFRDKLLTFVAEGEYTDSTVQTRHH